MIAELVSLIATEFDPRDPAFFDPIQRPQENVETLGGGQPHVDIEIETGGNLRRIKLAVVVVRSAQTQIAED